MCVKFSLKASKSELESIFNSSIDFNFTPIKEALPYKEYPIYTVDGFKLLVWGNVDSKIIHKRQSDLDSTNFKRGVLPITGFYTWKKEKIIAPIGFGDHKETLKLHPLHITQLDILIVNIPVLIKYNTFFIVVDNSSDKIKEYQPNEPLFINEVHGWLKNKSYDLSKFSDREIKFSNY